MALNNEARLALNDNARLALMADWIHRETTESGYFDLKEFMTILHKLMDTS